MACTQLVQYGTFPSARGELCAPWLSRPSGIHAFLSVTSTVCTRGLLIIALELHGCQLFLAADGDGWELTFLRRQKEHAFGARRLLCRPTSCILSDLEGLQPRNGTMVHIYGATVCLMPRLIVVRAEWPLRGITELGQASNRLLCWIQNPFP